MGSVGPAWKKNRAAIPSSERHFGAWWYARMFTPSAVLVSAAEALDQLKRDAEIEEPVQKPTKPIDGAPGPGEFSGLRAQM
jgi:hypothetical protein